MTEIINLDTEEVVAEIEDESVRIEDGKFEMISESMRPITYIYPVDEETSNSIELEEGEKGFARMFVESLPEPYDIRDLDELDDLPFPDDDDDGDDEEKSKGFLFDKAEWEPYVGPQGGSGWRNVENGEVIYDDEPPGGVDLPQEFEEEGLELFTDVSVENIDENDVLLAVEDGEIVARPAEELTADSEWFGVLTPSDGDAVSEEEYEEYFSEGDEVDLELIQPTEDGREQIEDATVTGTTDTGLFVEYTHPETGYDESHHVPWEEVADEELQSQEGDEEEVTQDPSNLSPGADVEVEIGGDERSGEITEVLADNDDWDYRFEAEDGQELLLFEDDIQDILSDGDIEDDELSTGEWEEYDTGSIDDISEGTEISVEISGQEPITGEFNGLDYYDAYNQEVYDVGGTAVFPEDVIDSETDLYVNEESVPDEDDDDEMSTGEWEERDPSDLANIPEGTEVSLEVGSETVTGEFDGPNDTGLAEEWTIDGQPFTIDEVLEPSTELYVNEESIPDEGETTESDIDDLLEEDPVITQQISDDKYGDELIEEAADVWDLPEDSYNVDTAAVKVKDVMEEAKKIPGVVESGEQDEDSEYYDYTLGGFLKELPEHTMPGDVHSLLVAAEVETVEDGESESEEDDDDSIPEEEQITSGEFDWKNVENVPEGVYVEMTSGNEDVEGTIVEHSTMGVEVELDDGDRTTVAPTSITSGVAYEEKPDDYELSDSPDKEELEQLAQRYNLGSTASKSAVGNFMAEVIDKNVSGQDVYDTIVDVSGSDPGPADSLLQKMVESSDSSKFSETLDTEVPLSRDRSVQSEINKRATKMFEDNNPEYAEYTSEIKEAISSWSGNSKNPESAPLWAVAVEDGENNIPETVANQIDRQDPEMVDATRAYIEETRKVMKDVFGDSLEVYRGISGSTGSRNAEQAEQDGETTIDHRAIASWTICPDTAKSFAHRSGSFVSREIDIDEIYASFSNAAGFGSEFEIVAAGGVDEYDYVDDPSEGFEAGDITTGKNYDDEELFVDSFEQFQELLEG